MPLDECKQKTTSTQFITWLEFLRREELRDTKQDYALAQIAAEVARSNERIRHPEKIKVKDFLIQFVRRTSQKESQEKRVAQSKQFWLGLAGVDK